MINEDPYSSTTDSEARKLSYKGESLYELLGVDKNSSIEEIHKAYRKLALRCHPDKNPDDAGANEKFVEINRANNVLTNIRKRKIYDQYGSFGLYLSDKMGDDLSSLYFAFKSPCLRCLLVSCFLLTGCCCCFCCCFCCACYRTVKEDEDIIFTYTDDMKETQKPITTQPVVQPSVGSTSIHSETDNLIGATNGLEDTKFGDYGGTSYHAN